MSFEEQMRLAETLPRKEYTGNDYCVASLLACDQGGPSQQDLLDSFSGGSEVPEQGAGGGCATPFSQECVHRWTRTDDDSARAMRTIEKNLPGGFFHPDAQKWATAIACHQSETAGDDRGSFEC